MSTNQGYHPPKLLKPYWIKSYYQQVQLVTNHDGTWDDEVAIEKGLATLNGGWLLIPSEFKRHHPRTCLFSKLEVGRKGMVRAWLYNPSVRAFYKTAEDRDLFMCWVDPDCLYEMFVV